MKVRADWLSAPAAQAVIALLEGHGHAALFVGGCVRNALLKVPVADLDLATDALPQQVQALAKSADLRTVPTGIDHGTITVIAHGTAIEVTTFRRDVATDGRRATVAFADTPLEDARRRDFTMNALYCDGRGEIVDPLDGLPDLRARYLRFVGRAEDRVREDYLRILRFFRFYAWYGDPEKGLDPEGLDACARHFEGLSQVSAERIGAELTKLLAAPDPAPAVAAMGASGVLGVVLPGADPTPLAPLVHLEGMVGRPPDPMGRLAALTAADIGPSLRLSKADSRRHAAISAAARDGDAPAVLGYRLGARDGATATVIRSALIGQPVPSGALDEVARGASATFPITARDLMPAFHGPALGQRLDALERDWLAGGLRASRDDLLR